MEPQPPPTPNNPNEKPLLTPEEFRMLAVRIPNNTHRIYSLQLAVNGVGMIGGIFALLWIKWHNTSVFVSYLVPCVCVFGLTAFYAESNIRNDKRSAERLARFIENSHDPVHIGRILGLYDTTLRLGNIWKQVRTEARIAVTRLLPLLQPSDRDALNTSQRARLRRSLFRPEYLSGTGDCISADYYFSVLHALEQIGDTRDLPDVDQLLKLDGLQNDVRTASEHCAQRIRERIACEEGKDFLLRADRKPDAVATLLRPSIERDDTPPQQLLRAATSDEGNTPA